MDRVTAAVMVLLAPNGKIPKDRSWKAAKVMTWFTDFNLYFIFGKNLSIENYYKLCKKRLQIFQCLIIISHLVSTR